MFQSARIKLTLWYLLIIMAVSLSFSAFIFRSIDIEFKRRLDVIERRLQLREMGFRPPIGQEELFIEDIYETRKAVFFVLLYTNSVIFFFSAVAGYFLAGRTLAPIEASLESQKRFVADASHELKTPLTALTTTFEVALRDRKLKLSDAKITLKEGLEEVVKLTGLTNDLLRLSRLQSGNGNISFEKMDLSDSIDRTIKIIKPIADRKKITVKKDLKKVYIFANQDSIEKLTTILLDNAVKYTPKGGVVFVKIGKGYKFVVLKVRDSGVGIPKDELGKVFNRFYRSDNSRTKEYRKKDGFGLGLSIAKEIVDYHKGSISVSSRVGKGSLFTVKLPA